ncbi:MAG: hypothetical protein ACK5BQ_10225 [Ignavibacteria bacterium]|jgi:hypothetical protein
MLAFALVVALTTADTMASIQDVDADTLELSADIDALDWLGIAPYSLRLGAVQRDTAFNAVSCRLDAAYRSTTLGIVLQTPAANDVPTGYWLQSHVGGMQFTLGDFGLFSGSGLLLGSASMGMRSTRSIQLPRNPIPFVRPWRARYRDPAIRGGACTSALDSGSLVLCVAGGMSMQDSITSLLAMMSHTGKHCTVGLNIHVQPEVGYLGASAWMQNTSGPHTMIAEIAGASRSDLSLQAAYRFVNSIMRFAVSLWSCGSNNDLPLGTLMAVASAPRNTWGAALCVGQTQRSFVGWDAWLVIRGSATRTYETPFPTQEYALRAEVRQSVTAQLHVTWRAFVTRDDDGQTTQDVRTQQQIHRIGLQSTVERIIRPSLLWRARADVRWIMSNETVQSSISTRIEVLWEPSSTVTLRMRALHFASPTYLIASRTVEYVSQDLQRMIYGSGYGLRCSLSALWKPINGIQCALLTSLTTSPQRTGPVPEVWIALSGQILRARDRHQLQEENAEL